MLDKIKKILRYINPAYRVALRIEKNLMEQKINDNFEKIEAIVSNLNKRTKLIEEIIFDLNNKTKSMEAILKKIDNTLETFPNQNLKKHLINFVGLETAEFIIKNMPKVAAFDNTRDLLKHALSFSKEDGLFLEFGVYNGRTINIISSIKNNKIVFGFDSFEGLPESWRTGFEKGTFKKEKLPEVNENVMLIKGWFDQTLPDFLNKYHEHCAFIHIDCDLYSSTKTVFDILQGRIVSGTIIVFDEYFNYPDWENGEYKAFYEFINENNLNFEYIGYTYKEQVAIKIL